jgi:threonine dehydrogenase-like Zn-dependent dehydrogenase
MAEKFYGYTASGLFGYSHMLGGYAGGQAEYVRVPFADVGPFKVPDHLTDEQVLFLTDIYPTGFMAAENCNIQSGDIVAVWGCGPVGQFAIRSAFLLGAGRVIAIDTVPERLMMANQGGAETLDSMDPDVFYKLRNMTGGLGPDACIDAVGMEAHGPHIDYVYDKIKTMTMMATDRVSALRQAIHSCRKGRDRVGAWCLRGVPGQDAVWRSDEQGADDQDRADARPQISAAAAALHREPRHRSVVRGHSSSLPRRGAGDVSHVPRQTGWLHQGRYEASLIG